MNDKDIQAQLNYLCRDKYYHAMQTVAISSLGKYHNDNVFQFYKGMAMLLGNYIPEAMREFESLQSDETVYLGSILALMNAHQRSVILDRDALKDLEINLKERRKKAQPMALYFAALFLFHCGKCEKAREYLDRSLKYNQSFIEGLVLKGWLELNSLKNENYLKDALHFFQSALDYDSNNLDALFGLITVNKMTEKYDTAVAILNRLIVKHPALVTPLVEKMKLQLAQRDWDQVLDLSNRILNIDRSNIEAVKLQAMCVLCRDGKYEETSALLEMLFTELERNEPKNTTLFILIAQIFSRISGRNEQMLNQTYKFANMAVKLTPNSVASLTELGYQMMLKGDIKDALETFQSATKLDESSLAALTYLTYCQIIDNGPVQTAQQQLPLLYEIQGKKTSMLLLMSAITNRDNPEKALAYLGEATVIHFDKCLHLPYGDVYLLQLDPDFLLLLVKEYLRYFPSLTILSDETTPLAITPNEAGRKCKMILSRVTEDCPALIEAIYLLARVDFYTGDIPSAINALNHIIKDVDATLVDAHLLLARIYLYQSSYQRAAQVLEVGVSYNFLVRESPLYHLINGMIAKNLQKLDECIFSLTSAMQTAGLLENSRAEKVDKTVELTLMDKATLYLEFADAQLAANNKTEAQKLMHDAIDIFKGTSEESRVTIANAEFLLKNQQIDIAFDMLEKIKPGDPYYLQAHTKLANLYLHNRRDRNAFTKCFREVVENCPGPETFILLGDAYMSVLELDLAIDSYRKALEQNVHDAQLASKMGKALVTTFRYEEAIIYYKEVIKNPININLKYDLAELYVKLDRFDEAEAILSEKIVDNTQSDDPIILSGRVKQLLLLAKVRENGGKFKSALSVTKEARDLQHKIQRRALTDQTGGINEQKVILSDICVRLAEICKHLRDNEQSIQHYKEALNATPDDSEILLALAKLYLQVNNQEQCEEVCSSLLILNPENEAASVIMADLAYRKLDFDTAIHHFKQLLLKQPTYWTALARLVEVARRTGNLDEMPEYLKRAEQNCNAPSKEAGFAYCTALHEWYTGNLNAALKNFNRARLDQEWGQQAIYNMIEVCLNPDDDLLGGDIFSETIDSIDSRQMAIEMAERLHRELKPRPGSMEEEGLNHRLLKNFILLATKQKVNIERALQDFTTIASQEAYREHVGPILGLASAYTLLKQGPRARNHLKRVVKNAWSYEDAEYLERCWLLLADNYLQSNKYEIANDLLKRVLQHNKSCVKAYEYAGYIAEKDQSYKEAAHNYDKAWKLSGKSKPAIGYKLAYTFLKSKQYADAIDVSNQVLKDFPEYPKIKKDILEKARNNLRT